MLSNLQKRILLFLTGCLGSRLALVYAAKTAGPAMLEVLGALAILPAAGFFYIYLTGARKTGAEVFGDRIWWNHLRPFHGFLYATFAVLALFHVPHAWMVLLLDVLVGAAAFVHHHGTQSSNLLQE
jgi:hypothetical protein